MAEIAERIQEAPEVVLTATLAREIQLEQRIRAQLSIVQTRIRTLQDERARRLGVDTRVGAVGQGGYES
jgi:hypothetical protein